MKKEIILVNCPPWGVDRPPLGLGTIAQYLENSDIKVKVFDFNIELYKNIDKRKKFLWDMNNHELWIINFQKVKDQINNFDLIVEEFANKILKENIDIIGFSIASPKGFFAVELIKKIKEKDINKRIIIGGPLVSTKEGINFFLEKIPSLINFFVVETSEKLLKELVLNINEAEKIPGVVKNQNEKITKLIKQEKQENSLKTTFPKYSGFPLKKYIHPDSLDIEWSRGCIANCSFCSVRAMNGFYKSKPPIPRLKEIKYHYNRGVKHFSLADSTINGNIKYLEQTCDLIIKSKMNIFWSGQAIPRKEMTPQLFKKMRLAGCNRLEFGVESGSNKTLSAMKKINTVEVSEKNLKDCYKAGIQTVIYLIIGFPGETEDDFKETLNFLERNKEFINIVRSFRQPYLVQGADITVNPNKYGINVEKDCLGIKWSSKNNDFKTRIDRIQQVKNKLDLLNIKYDLFDQKDIINANPNILLFNPPPWGIEDPPTGLAYLASYLKNKKISVNCYDLNIELYNLSPLKLRNLWHVENKNYWKNKETFKKVFQIYKKKIENSVQKIIKTNPSIIAFNVVDPKERITIEIIKQIKELNPKIKILLGGPGTNTSEARSWFTNSIPELIECYVVGEGEETLYEATRALLKNKSIDNIPGIITYKNKKYNIFKQRKLLQINKQNIWPTYEEFDLNEYHSDALRVEWSRGCIGNCVFCKGKAINPGYRFRNPKSIVEELKYHVKNNNKKRFIVVDLTVNGNLKRLEEVCDLIIKKKLNIKWLAQGIPRTEMDLNFCRKMKKAGCYEFQIGVESGSDKVLKIMKKRHSVSEAEKCIRNLSNAGIKTGIFIMVGFPCETEKDFNKTLNFIEKNHRYISYIKSINAVHLIENTDLQENAKKYGIITLKDKHESKFPECEWYYKWETKSGNNWDIRQIRMKKMYELLKELKIPLVETNFNEGKENKQDKNIKEEINLLQDLQKFSNLDIQVKTNNFIGLFFKCLKEHGLIYTLEHVVAYLKK
ncbi:MAG: radical SAM protein [Nanoarchaeota archaeon]|nr:B12-binding domain-containing radical SAM protein [Nanoarchaeota archaeon]